MGDEAFSHRVRNGPSLTVGPLRYPAQSWSTQDVVRTRTARSEARVRTRYASPSQLKGFTEVALICVGKPLDRQTDNVRASLVADACSWSSHRTTDLLIPRLLQPACGNSDYVNRGRARACTRRSRKCFRSGAARAIERHALGGARLGLDIMPFQARRPSDADALILVAQKRRSDAVRAYGGRTLAGASLRASSAPPGCPWRASFPCNGSSRSDVVRPRSSPLSIPFPALAAGSTASVPLAHRSGRESQLDGAPRSRGKGDQHVPTELLVFAAHEIRHGRRRRAEFLVACACVHPWSRSACTTPSSVRLASPTRLAKVRTLRCAWPP